MIWDKEVSIQGFFEKVDEWYDHGELELCDPPINAQYALDLIFKTLIDDKENYPFLTTMSESVEQTNSIMVDLILEKYSKEYTNYKKSRVHDKERNEKRNWDGDTTNELTKFQKFKKKLSIFWNELLN